MESYLGALCPGTYVKEAGKYGWPALATLVWAHRFYSRTLHAMNELGEPLWLDSAATKLHYGLENVSSKPSSVFWRHSYPYTRNGMRIYIF